MAISTRGTMSSQITTAHNWRSLLASGATTRRHIVGVLPLELRLVLMTTAVVLTLVASGAQLASALGVARIAPASQTAHPAVPVSVSDASASWQPDGICHPVATTPRMISAAELETPHIPGAHEAGPGLYRPCQIRGLAIPDPTDGAPSLSGQVILVSLSQQWLWAYQDGAMVFANPVATGMPYLRTPRGTYHIQYKRADTTFYSPWPRSSPFYYTPEHINYALNFRAGGFYIHDAPWRQMYGPGAQDPHTTPDGHGESGSHGCVNMTTSAAAWLYSWAHVGATVQIVA